MLFHLSGHQFFFLGLSVLIDLADMSDVSLIWWPCPVNLISWFFTRTRWSYNLILPFSKVVSAFHLNDDIVLLSLFPGPFNPKVFLLHTLDVIRVIRVYLQATSFFYWTDCCLLPLLCLHILSVSTFCAVLHQDLVLEIWNAATLSSVHTFTRFYQVDLVASVYASFDSKTLQSAV